MDRVIRFPLWDLSRIAPTPWSSGGSSTPAQRISSGPVLSYAFKGTLAPRCLPAPHQANSVSVLPEDHINGLASSARRMGRAAHVGSRHASCRNIETTHQIMNNWKHNCSSRSTRPCHRDARSSTHQYMSIEASWASGTQEAAVESEQRALTRSLPAEYLYRVTSRYCNTCTYKAHHRHWQNKRTDYKVL